LPMDLVIARELEIYGSHGMAARDYPAMLRMVADGTLRPGLLVGEVIGLGQVGRALAAMDEPGSGAGMTVVSAAGIAAPPTADAAACRLTILVVPVVSVNSGKTGAAARPSSISPATASAPEPGPGMGSAISMAPSGTPATAAARTRAGPRRSATGPSTTRPTHIIAQ